MKIPAMLRHLALAGACLAIADDTSAGPVSRCRDAATKGDWRDALVACQASYERDPRPRLGLALARAKMNLGDDDGALSLARRAEIGETRAEALQIVGIVLDRRGEVAAARSALGDALVLFRGRGESREAARTAYALAGSYWREARYKETLAQLDASMRDAQVSRDARMMGYVSLMRGDVLRAIGDAREAERAYREADAALGATRSDRAYVQLKTGMLHRDAGRPALAKRAFEDALATASANGLRDVEAAAHLNLAYAAHLEGDVRAGLDHLEGLSGTREVSYLYNRALLEADRGDLAEAARLFDEAETAVKDDEWAWDVAYERGRVAEKRGEPAEADRAYRASIRVVERMRDAFDLTEMQPWILQHRREPYEALFALLARGGKKQEALSALELFTARSFLDSLVREERAGGEGAMARADELEALFRGLRGEPSSVEIGVRLLEREVLVHVEARGRLWIVHRGRGGEIAIDDRGDAAQVRTLIERLLASLDDSAVAEELGALLIPERVTASDDILYIVPTGRFLSLPYAALRRGVHRLVEERPIALAASLRALAASPRFVASEGALVVADADGTLPAAREEAVQIGRLLGVTPYTQADATRERLRTTASLHVLHLATHAGIDAGGAWLRLADGRWAVRDVLASKLRADVVVLAGCSSASTHHEEMWGSLAAAFLANGSGAVVAMLGSVDDADARAVVTSLYRHGVTDDPARALSAVQREMARALPPQRWASFVVYGSSASPRGRSR